jgi:hypothetical protein
MTTRMTIIMALRDVINAADDVRDACEAHTEPKWEAYDAARSTLQILLHPLGTCECSSPGLSPCDFCVERAQAGAP